MSHAAATWIVIALALVGANFPFFTHKLLGVVALEGGKRLSVRLAELVLLYFGVGGIGLLLEQRAGQIAPQGWEFYAITGTLFLTLAFPGFVWRYLVKHRP